MREVEPATCGRPLIAIHTLTVEVHKISEQQTEILNVLETKANG
jgi:hypothetical protein